MSDEGDIYIYSYINENFKGMDTLRLPTTTRTHGDLDAYIAKINPDFTLAWDFAIGGERADVPWVPTTYEYYHAYFGYDFPYNEEMTNSFVVVGDTLLLKAAVFSNGTDIDMDPNKEVLLNTTDCEHDAVVAKYLLKKDGLPELIDYKYGYTMWLPHKLLKGKNDHIFAVNQDSVNRLLRYYREIDEKYRTYGREEYPYNLYSAFWFSNQKSRLNFDKRGNIYVNMMEGYNCDPIDVRFSDKSFLYSPTDIDMTAAIAKYDSSECFQWAVCWPYISWEDSYAIDYHGGLYVGGYNIARTTKAYTDLDPNPNEEVVYPTEPGVFARYVETFRIKAEQSSMGVISLPEKYVRWGDSCEMRVLPNVGFEVDSIFTSRGESFVANSDGTYILKEIVSPVVIRATYKKTSAVDDCESAKGIVYPAMTSDFLQIKNGSVFEHLEIVDSKGSVLNTLKGCDKIDVSGLSAGTYFLRMRKDDMFYVERFVKC